MTAFTTNMQAVEHVFGGVAGKHLLDIGCGRGPLARALLKRGAKATGVDPNPEAVAAAREAVPGARFEVAGAEALPFADGAFDGAVILNSLHHVPETKIDAALAEAMRVVRPGGRFLILEPLARGGYQVVCAPIDDETKVRAVALRKLDAFIARTGAEVILRTEFDTLIPEESGEAVLDLLAKVDPSRAARIEAAREQVLALFEQHAIQTERGPALDQPMIAVALTSGPAQQAG